MTSEAQSEWVGVTAYLLYYFVPFFNCVTSTRSVAFRANHVPPHKEEAVFVFLLFSFYDYAQLEANLTWRTSHEALVFTAIPIRSQSANARL